MIPWKETPTNTTSGSSSTQKTTISISANLALYTQPRQRTPLHSLSTVLYRALTCARGHTMVCICTVTLLFQCRFLFSNGLTSGKGQVWAGLDVPFIRYLTPKPQDCLSGLMTLLLLFPPSAHLGSIIPRLLFKALHRRPCSPYSSHPRAPVLPPIPVQDQVDQFSISNLSHTVHLQTHIFSALAAWSITSVGVVLNLWDRSTSP